jgi:hypothetical protein
MGRMTTGKTAPALEAMTVRELADRPECRDLVNVIVTPRDGPAGDWEVTANVRSGATLSADCHRARMAVVQRLRRDYHLLRDR